MKLPLLVLNFWLLFLGALVLIQRLSGSFELALCTAVGYLCATCALEHTGYQSRWLRRCALIHWLQERLAVPAQLARGAKEHLLSKRQRLYAVEPHGEACLGFATTFVPSESGEVRVLVWSAFRFIPLLRDIYLLVGLVPATSTSADRWLTRGSSLAVIPSGLTGLYGAIVDKGGVYNASTGRRQLRVYQVNLGFCALAIKRKLLLVPVLSCYEDVAFRKLRLFDAFPFLSTFVTPTWVRSSVVVGVALDGARYTDVDTLATDYYTRLSAMAHEAGHELELVDATRSASGKRKTN